jgi:uncharacterized membrane protein
LIRHIGALVFVFLAGTALAMSVERKLSKGFESNGIDKDILLRGAFIVWGAWITSQFWSFYINFSGYD